MATKYTEAEIQKALLENKKPERMSSTYWSKLKRGLVGKCYNVSNDPEKVESVLETLSEEKSKPVENEPEVIADEV